MVKKRRAQSMAEAGNIDRMHKVLLRQRERDRQKRPVPAAGNAGKMGTDRGSNGRILIIKIMDAYITNLTLLELLKIYN